MKKQEVYAFLDEKKISYEVTEHKAVYNMDELSKIDIPYPEADAKNFLVRDDKNYMEDLKSFMINMLTEH